MIFHFPMKQKNKNFAFFIILCLLTGLSITACNETEGGGSGSSAYTVTFDKNHNDNIAELPWTEADPKTVKTKPLGTVTLPTPPSRKNYTFLNWNTRSDGKGLEFTTNIQVQSDTSVYAQWAASSTEPYTINLSVSGKEGADNVSVTPASGNAGANISINYTLADTKINNRLVLSGAFNQTIETPGSGALNYTINPAHASDDRSISINASFTHTALQFNTIAFEKGFVNKTFGDSPFTQALSDTGSGSGTISYSSSDTMVATVNNSALVTILKAGHTTITAEKAADSVYEQTSANYILNIEKAGGAHVSVPAVSGSPTTSSITVAAVTLTGNTEQVAEYACNTSGTTPQSGWQTGTTFSSLNADTNYYIFARAKESTNYLTGAVQTSHAIKTASQGSNPPVDVQRYSIVDFEADTIGKTYSVTKAENNGTATATVVADPANSGQKSLRVTTNGFNLAAIVPIILPNQLQDYKEYSFRIRMVTPSSHTNSVLVYAAGAANQFVDYGFGNGADSEYAQYASRLAGKTPESSFGNSWTSYTVTISSPGNDIKNLQDTVQLAIGIHTNTTLEYLLDDIMFTLKDDVTPVLPPTPPPAVPLSPPSTGAIYSGVYRNLYTENGWKTAEQVNAKVQQMYNDLFNGTGGSTDPSEAGATKIYHETGSDMAYIWDTGNNDVRSEGMSYGMMMCVQMNDQTRFNKLWKWARTYMYHDRNGSAGGARRGYYAWQVSTSGVKGDQNPAPDGEFYFTTALLFAHARWGSASGTADIFNYQLRARELLYDMCHRDRSTDGYNGKDDYDRSALFRRPGDHRQNNTVANPMPVGNNMPVFSPEEADKSDPSYHLPAFYEVWALELEQDIRDGQLYGVWANLQELQDDAAFYRQAAETSRAYFQTATHATAGLGADYAAFNGTPTGSQNYFGYDAFRIALNIGMDYAWFAKDLWQKTFADRIQSFFQNAGNYCTESPRCTGINDYRSRWNIANGWPNGAVTSRNNDHGDHSPGLVACNAAVSLAATNERAWLFLEDFWNISMTKGRYRYYDGCLSMLGLLNITGNFKVYLRDTTRNNLSQ